MDTLFPQLLFGALTAVILVPRVRLEWALLAYLVLVHLDWSSAVPHVAVDIGIRNLLAVVVAPTALLLRVPWAKLKGFTAHRGLRLWAAFCIYVAVASAWSAYPIPALKQLGYLYAYTALLIVFSQAFASAGRRMPWLIAASLAGALLLGTVQSFMLGDAFGQHIHRFTSFSAPQYFGLYLGLTVGLLAAFVSAKKLPVGLALSLCAAAVAALSMNGSRQGMVTALASGGLWVFLACTRPGRRTVPAIVAGVLLVAALIGVRTIGNDGIDALIGSQRALETLRLAADGEEAADRIGTLKARLGIYRALYERIGGRSIGRSLFGNGTSSTADLIVAGDIKYRDYDEHTVDGNRLAHNEFLRALYEWGVVGFLLLVSVIVWCLVVVARLVARAQSDEAYILALLAVLLVGVFPLLGNVLAAPAAPLGPSLAMVIALAAYSGGAQSGRGVEDGR